MDLEALDFPEQVDDEEAHPKQVEEEGVAPIILEEAWLDIPEEQSPSNVVARVLSKLAPQEGWAESEFCGGEEPDSSLIRQISRRADLWMS